MNNRRLHRVVVFLSIILVVCTLIPSTLGHGSYLRSGEGELEEEEEEEKHLQRWLTPSPALRSVPDFCIESSRCQTLHTDRIFSFVHISKAAGASWIGELQTCIPKSHVFPDSPQGLEHSVSFQNSITPFDFLSYHLIALRSPRHHVWSLFTECKYDGWGKEMTKDTDFPRNGTTPADDVRDYRHWLKHFLKKDHSNQTNPINGDSYGCYRPINYQTNAMTGTSKNPGHAEDKRAILEPDFTRSLRVYETMDWVALTDFFHESKCLLYHRLEPKTAEIVEYLETKCRCDASNGERQRRRKRRLFMYTNDKTMKVKAAGGGGGGGGGGQNHRDEVKNNKNGDVHTTHHANGHRSSMVDLPADILELVNALTRSDQKLYKVALVNFLREMVWLEMQLDRQVLCDSVLEKWEPELAYLNISVTSTYNDEKSRLGNQR